MTVSTLPITSLAMHDLSMPCLTRFRRHAKDIHTLAKRILKDGLLNPITVKRKGADYVVVDGGKRLAAIQLLNRAGRLPRSLSRVPCIVADDGIISAVKALPARPVLKSDAELARAINAAVRAGASRSAVAARFDCAAAMIDYAQSLDALHPQICDYFNSGHISLEQAAAFATLECRDSQWRLLQELGPFAHASEVIAAILKGETVVEMPDGNVMIMPSRKRLAPRRDMAA